MTIKCDRCAAYLVLTADLLDRVSGKTGRVTCHGCGEKVGLDARGEQMLLVGGQLAPEPELELEEAPSLRGAQLSLLPPPPLAARPVALPVRPSMRAPLPPPRPSARARQSEPPAPPADPFDPLGSLAPLVPLQGVHLTADGRLVNRADEPPAKPRSRVRTWAPLLVAALLGTGLASARVGSILPLGRSGGASPKPPAAAPPHSLAAAPELQATPPSTLAAAAPAVAPSSEVSPEATLAADEVPLLRAKEEEAAKAVSPADADASEHATLEDAATEASPAEGETAPSAGESPEGAEAATDAPDEASAEGADEALEAPAFSKDAATVALQHAAAEALSCRQPGDPAGSARVIVTFAPSGRVTSANISGGPFAGTSTGGCIAARFRGATVPAFSGGYVTVSKTISIE